jgi:hypothetical protein
MCGVWRGYDVAGVGGGEFALRLASRQRVTPLYWRSDTHTHTHIHNLMKTLSSDPVIGTVVKVPIQAKMEDDNVDLDGFHFGSIQESELDPPLVLESVWDCLGITLNTTKDDDGKTILGWRCSYCLIPGNCGCPRFFKHHNASKVLSHLTKGKDIVNCTGFLNRIDVFKGK